MHQFPYVDGMIQQQVSWQPGLQLRGRAYNPGCEIKTLSVLEYEPHHLKQFRPGSGWAHPENRGHLDGRTRIDSTYGDYYGKDCPSEGWLEKRIEKGWPEGVAKIQPLIEKIRDLVPVAQRKRRKPVWTDQGDEIDMRRVWSGNLEQAWRSTRKRKVEGERVISIDIAVGHNANVRADALFWAGAAGVAMTDVLEDRGYRVELYATSGTFQGAHAGISRLRVKRADQPLNLYDVAILTAHPATYRWYQLNSWTRFPYDIGMGFGQSVWLAEPLKVAVDAGVIQGSDLVVENALSESKAVERILEAVEMMDARHAAGV